VGEFSELLDRQLHLPGKLVEHLGAGGRVVGDDVARETEIHGEGDEMLLRTVVEIAFDPATFGVTAGHDARPRLAQGVRLLAQLVERRLQRRVQLRVVERQPDLPGEVGEHPIVVFGEGGVSRDALDDDESEQFPGVADGRHPQLSLSPVRSTGRATRRMPRRSPTPRHGSRPGAPGLETTIDRGPASGTDTALSSTSPIPVYTSALTSPMVLRRDSDNCSRSSSMGMARVKRLPKVRSTSSGACRAP
jgi:hypothetical protein